MLVAFGYDAAGRLATITEKTGGIDNITTIQHDAAGRPTSITAPFGQQTQLGVDANGWLDRVTNMANETTTFAYTPDGLMTGMTTPRNHAYVFGYDGKGRLMSDADPAGGSQTLTRSEIEPVGDVLAGREVALETGLGRVSRYRVEHLMRWSPARDQHHRGGDCHVDALRYRLSQTTTAASGLVRTDQDGPDPRFGMLAPVAKSAV